MSSKSHYNSRHRTRSPSRRRSRSPRHKHDVRKRSKSRSPSRRSSMSHDRHHRTNGHRRDSPERHHSSRASGHIDRHDNFRPQSSHKKLSHEDEFLEMRRQEREVISLHECPLIWGKSPLPDE